MKRVIIAVVVFLIVITVSIGSLFVLKKSTDEMYVMTQTIETSVANEDFDQAQLDIQKFISYWENHKNILVVIVHLQNIENINDIVAMLQPLADAKSKSSLIVTISRLKVLIEDLYENEFPFIYNIL
ncbi:MAG: DUF4363 family protein [Oscillospiraceae bacterium]